MRKYQVLSTVLVFIWIILAVVFGICDLDISMQIVNQNSAWAKFLENYGMIPGILVILSGIFIYYSRIKQKKDLWSWIKKIVFFLTTTGLILYLFDIVMSNSIGNNVVIDHLFIFSVISFSISIIIFIVLLKSGQVKSVIAIKYSKVVLGVALFGYVFFIQVLKYFWGRVRFRELDSMFSQFTPWYLPQGFTGFDSFPSGHAAMGFMLLPLIILFSNNKSWQKNLVILIFLIWGIVLASSRVIIGAHYASDVLFGSFFIIATFLFFNKKYSEQIGN